MEFTEFIRSVENELLKPLPGKDAQLQMASMRRLLEFTDLLKKENGIKSSVLILLYPSNQDNDIFLVLIQRPKYDGIHSGQISLPGGRSEPADANPEATAIRETHEEIGIDAEKIKIIGSLTELYIPPSNYLVLPFVGYTIEKPEFHNEPREVESIIELRIKDLMDDDRIVYKDIYVNQGLSIYGPCFETDDCTIWGATAMILNEFKEILRRSLGDQNKNSINAS